MIVNFHIKSIFFLLKVFEKYVKNAFLPKNRCFDNYVMMSHGESFHNDSLVFGDLVVYDVKVVFLCFIS